MDSEATQRITKEIINIFMISRLKENKLKKRD